MTSTPKFIPLSAKVPFPKRIIRDKICIDRSLFEIKIVIFIASYGTILGSMYAVGLFSGPISGAIIDKAASQLNFRNQSEAVSEIAGAYTGLNSFMITISPGFASILVGFILTGTNESNPIIITLCLSSTVIFYFLSWFYIRQIKLITKPE